MELRTNTSRREGGSQDEVTFLQTAHESRSLSILWRKKSEPWEVQFDFCHHESIFYAQKRKTQNAHVCHVQFCVCYQWVWFKCFETSINVTLQKCSSFECSKTSFEQQKLMTHAFRGPTFLPEYLNTGYNECYVKTIRLCPFEISGFREPSSNTIQSCIII